MNFEDIQRKLEKFLWLHINDSSDELIKYSKSVGSVLESYRREIIESHFFDWGNDIYIIGNQKKPIKKTNPSAFSNIKQIPKPLNDCGRCQPSEKGKEFSLQLIRVIYEDVEGVALSTQEEPRKFKINPNSKQFWKENNKLEENKIEESNTDSLQYCAIGVYKEEYQLRYQESGLWIEDFRYEVYKGIDTIQHNQLKLKIRKGHLPQFVYVLKAKLVEGCRYLCLMLNNCFQVLNISANIGKIIRKHHYILLELEDSLHPLREIDISMKYQPRDSDSEGIFYIKNNGLFLSWVCGFFPANIGESFHFIINHAGDQTVIINGEEIKREAKEEIYKIKTAEDLCLYISSLQEVNEGHIRFYTQRKIVKGELSDLSQIYQFYENYHQVPKTKKQLKIIENKRLLVDGLSFPGVIFLNTRINQLPKINRTNIIAHELAHQWWGNYIKFKGDLANWLKESFPEYLKNIYIRGKNGIDFFNYQMRKSAALYFALEQCQTDVPISQSLENEKMHDGLIYGKGVYVIHMLTKIIGDDMFRRVIRKFMAINKERYVQVKGFEDFLKTLEEETGACFDWFFQQWLFKKGCPSLDIKYAIKGNHIKFSVCQGESIFKLPIDVSIFHFSGEKTTQRVWISQQSEEIEWIMDHPIEKIMIDPENDLLQRSPYLLSAAHVITGINQDDNQLIESELLKAYHLDPENIEVYYYLIKFYHRQKRFKECGKLFKKVSELTDPIHYFKPKITALFKDQI